MEAIGTLAGGIAHDFSNILAIVDDFTKLALDQTANNGDLQDDLEQVHKAGIRGRDLTKQILKFARQSEDDLQPVRVDHIAQEVCKFMRSTLSSSIEQKLEIRSTSLVLANPVKIHQVFLNLCSNAAYAMNDTGLLIFSVDETTAPSDTLVTSSPPVGNNYLGIRVSDTGPGIPSEPLDRIFEPFLLPRTCLKEQG